MAINVKTKYPANAAAPSTDYLTGSFQNDSSPEAEDGTPLEKDWANDFLGARDAILSEGGVTPSGSVETAQSSDVLTALLQIITDNQSLPPSQDQTAWNGGVSTVESIISSAKLDAKIKTLSLGDGGQTRQNLTSSRSVNVEYTNSTGRSIEVGIVVGLDTNTNVSFILDGIDLNGRPGSTFGGITLNLTMFTATIPNGSTYELSRNAGSILNMVWTELR